MNRSLIILGIVLLPQTAGAGIEITEIAWMGSVDNSSNEWVELHNTGSEAISLENWIFSFGDTRKILSAETNTGDCIWGNTIEPGAYVVLERSDDTTLPAVTAFFCYTGALVDSGMVVSIEREDGVVQDTVSGGEGWINIGGDIETRETAQWTGTSWVTAAPTPGSVTVSGGSPSENDDDDSSDSGGGGSGVSAKKVVEEEKLPGVLSLSLTGPGTVYVGQESAFTAVPSGVGPTITNSLKYLWNFGDLETGEGKEVIHTYTLPGTYVLVLEAAFGEHLEIVEKTITVLPISLLMSRSDHGDLLIKNVATHDIRLDGYTLRGSREVVFPKYSIIKSNGTLTIPGDRIEDIPGFVLLLDEGGEIVASLSMAKISSEMAATPPTTVRSAPPQKKTTPPKEVILQSVENGPLVNEFSHGEDIATATTVAREAAQVAALSQTIPLYESGAEKRAPRNLLDMVLPYVGFVVLITGGLLVLQRIKGLNAEEKKSPPMPF